MSPRSMTSYLGHQCQEDARAKYLDRQQHRAPVVARMRDSKIHRARDRACSFSEEREREREREKEGEREQAIKG